MAEDAFDILDDDDEPTPASGVEVAPGVWVLGAAAAGHRERVHMRAETARERERGMPEQVARARLEALGSRTVSVGRSEPEEHGKLYRGAAAVGRGGIGAASILTAFVIAIKAGAEWVWSKLTGKPEPKKK